MNERWNIHNSFEVIQSKFVGTGHSDMTKWEWGTNIQRDSLASHIGHKSRLLYMSVAQNQSTFRTKMNFLDKMVQPCGPAPKRNKEDLDEEI